MTDYNELVKALRILQDKNSLSYYKRQVCKDAAAAIEALQAQLPKRGEWINSKERIRPDMCSVCGCVYEADRFMDKIAWNYCPNCGSLMAGENDERN